MGRIVEPIGVNLERISSVLSHLSNELREAEKLENHRISNNKTVKNLDLLSESESPVEATEWAEDVIYFRKIRNELFGEYNGIFSDPNWDIILYLFKYSKYREAIKITSVCHASGVPQTAALRYLAILEQFGLIERADDPFDRRRKFITLTAKAAQLMQKLHSAISQTRPLICS